MASETDDDGSIFLFFLLSLLICIVIPWSLSVLWHLANPGKAILDATYPTVSDSGLRVRECRTQVMTAKRADHKRRLTSRRENCSRGFACRSCILILLLFWLIIIGFKLRAILATSTLYANFDPYALLGVSHSDGKATVKKAFRKLSLQFHPDKNPDPAAVGKFILIKKAYDSLTDPVAKANFARYGNPDGPTRVDMGVALPTFSKEYQAPVLIIFVLVFIIGVPLAALCVIQGSQSERCANGLLKVTVAALAKNTTQSLDIKAAQSILLSTAESVSYKPRDADEGAEIESLLKKLNVKGPKSGRQLGKADVLFNAHVTRQRCVLSNALAKDLDDLLPLWRSIVLTMVDIASQEGFSASLASVLDLHKCLVQALDPGMALSSSEFFQVPHMDADRQKILRKNSRKGLHMSDFVALSAEESKKTLEKAGFEGQELLDALEFVRVFPRISVSESKVFVIGEDSIHKDDIATIQVVLKREDVATGEFAHAALTSFFPTADVLDAWRVSFKTPSGKGFRTRVVRTACMSETTVVESKFKVSATGRNKCTIVISAESYAGLEVETQMTFTAGRSEAPAAPTGDDNSENESVGSQ